MSSPATNGWSVINIMRKFGVNTRAAIHASWEAGTNPPQTAQTISIAKVDDGVAYLVGAGFATYNGGTTVVTATNIGSDGKPARLKRSGDGLALLGPGERQQEGT